MGVFYLNRDGMPLQKLFKDRGMSLKSLMRLLLDADHSGPLPATDSWNLGALIYEIFNGAFSNSEQLNSKGKIPQVHRYCILIDNRIFSPHINVY